MAESGGLAARRRAQTEREIEDAAIAAFEQFGFAGTTMEEIASRAGVSVRTAFRYFPAKVDTVLFSARFVAQLLGDGMSRDLAGGASLTQIDDSVEGSLAMFDAADHDVLDRLRRVRSLMLTDPQFRAQVVHSEDYAIGVDGGAERPLEERMRARIVAATLGVAFDEWAGPGQGNGSMVESYRRARGARNSLLR